MYICICNAITDRQINEAVEKGATTLTDLQLELGVATDCGTCMDSAMEFLPAPTELEHVMQATEVVRSNRSAANDTQLAKEKTMAISS